MDPLSLTLSVISLATTISNMLDLAVNLRDSFEQVSRNMENARRLASELVSTLQQLKELYDENIEILENSRAMRSAIVSLESRIRGIHSKCCAITRTPASKTPIQNVKIALKSWTNRKKVEEDLKELKNRVNLCYTQFTTFASARVEVSTQKIQDVVIRIATATTRMENRMLTLDQLQVFGLEPSKRQSLLDFRQRNTYLADSYLCSEIEAMNAMLRDLCFHVSAELPGPYYQPFMPVFHVKPPPKNKLSYRREVITKTIDMLGILQAVPVREISIQQAAWNLVNLSIGLYHLELYPEAVVTGIWTTHLFRVLDAQVQSAYRPYLILSLHNLSQYHTANKDDKKACTVMSECLRITRALARESPTPEIVGFLSRSLTESSRIAIVNQEYSRSLKESQEAVRVSEDALFILSGSRHIKISVSDLDTLHFISECLSRWTKCGMIIINTPDSTTVSGDEKPENVILQGLHDYARALHQLSYSLHHHERFMEAIDADKRAMQIIRYIKRKGGILFDTEMAEVLFHLSNRDFRPFISPEEAMCHIQESVEIYQRISIDGSVLYCQQLYHVLYLKATILRTMKDYTKEIEVWTEAAKTALSIHESLLYANALYQTCWSLRHLDRFDEAINMRMDAISTYRTVMESPTQIVADAQYDLAVDLQLLKRHEEARAAAQEAISEYRSLALCDCETTTEGLANSVTLLTSILLSVDEINEAMDTGEEALKLFQSIVSQSSPETDTISKYVHCLDINMTASFKLSDATKAIKRSFLVVGLLEEILTLCPDQDTWGLNDFWESHSLLLNKYDRLAEARKWIDRAIQWFETHMITNSHQIERFMICLCNYALILDSQGFREKALESVVKAIHLAKAVAHPNSSLASIYVATRTHQVDLLWELGQYHQALSLSEDAIAFARRSQVVDIEDFIDCLLIYATTLNCNNQPERSIGIVNEIIELCRSNTSAVAQKNNVKMLQLSYAFRTLSKNHAGLGRHDESLEYAQKSLDQLLQIQSDLLPFQWSHRVKYPYAMLSINLAECLAAVGKYEGALKLLSDARVFFEETSPSRNGYYIELSRVLGLISLLHCSFERHEEGANVSASLSGLRKRLAVVFPSLARLIDQEFERKTILQPSWLKPLNMALDYSCPCIHGQALSDLARSSI